MNHHAQALPADRIVQLPGGAIEERWDLPITHGRRWLAGPPKLVRLEELRAMPEEEAGNLVKLCVELFHDHWRQIVFGPCIEGAVFEFTLQRQPHKISMLDGYLTVHFDDDRPEHFHLCLGPTRGLANQPTPPELAAIRPCRQASFYRISQGKGCSAMSWGIRLENGRGEQMTTFFLPIPWFSREGKRQPPDWSKLDLWNDLRARYLGETGPQPLPDPPGSDVHG